MYNTNENKINIEDNNEIDNENNRIELIMKQSKIIVFIL